MNNVVYDYDLTISDFLSDVGTWLDERVPRHVNDIAEIADTKAIWRKVQENPRIMVQYDKFYNYVCGHTSGFVIKRGTDKCDKEMLFVVMSVLAKMDDFYQNDGFCQKKQLLDAIKKYKIMRTKNPLTRAIISLKKPERFLLGKQR